MQFINRTYLIGLATLAFAGGVFVGVQHTHSASAGFEPVRFEPAADWHVRTGSVHACPGVKATRCSQVSSVVSTIPSRDCLTCLPHKTVAAMAPGDILIQVQLAVEHPTYARRAFAWPPRIRRNQVPAGFEGLPNHISVYQGQTRVGPRQVFVFAVFGRALPTQRQLDRANAELRRAHIPG